MPTAPVPPVKVIRWLWRPLKGAAVSTANAPSAEPVRNGCHERTSEPAISRRAARQLTAPDNPAKAWVPAGSGIAASSKLSPKTIWL